MSSTQKIMIFPTSTMYLHTRCLYDCERSHIIMLCHFMLNAPTMPAISHDPTPLDPVDCAEMEMKRTRFHSFQKTHNFLFFYSCSTRIVCFYFYLIELINWYFLLTANAKRWKSERHGETEIVKKNNIILISWHLFALCDYILRQLHFSAIC